MGEFIRFVLEILEEIPNVTAREIRAYYYFKFGLQNKETIAVAGWTNVITAMKGAKSSKGSQQVP